jgi:hypothetical protein
MRQLAAALLLVLFVPSFEAAQSRPDQLTLFLQNYVGTLDEETKKTEYAAAFVDLKDDGTKEAIVYLSSDGWCGTGGCTLLILAPEGTSYRVVTKVPAVRLPIRVLDAKSNGWHDIGVVARKSGVEPLYEAILSFDGKSYPIGVSEAGESNGKAQGKIVMAATAKARPLYQ